jgi:biopolymer transport protein ExbB
MNTLAIVSPLLVVQAEAPEHFGSLWDTLVDGGPVMIPLAVCSVLALMWVLERMLRLRASRLGGRTQAEALVAAARDLGPARALDLARASSTMLTRIVQPMLERWSEPRANLEQAVEEIGSREVRGLVTSLRPLSVITALAPLLGLLGTVIGIIIAFRDIALSDAMGKPEALATGIAQALVTTAAGLSIAIPTQAAYYWFRSKIDRYGKLVEETGDQLLAVREGRAPAALTAAPVLTATPPPPPAPMAVAAQGSP